MQTVTPSSGRKATIIVLEAEDRRQARRFLEDLRRQVHEGDEILLADGSRAVSRHVVREGRLLPRPLGEARASFALTVVVSGRLVLSRSALDRLRETVEGEFRAAAPLSNRARGSELFVGVPYRPHQRSARDAFLVEVASGAARPRAAEVLYGPCLARRFDDAPRLDALLPYDPLALTAGLAPGELAVVEGAFAHDPGGAALAPMDLSSVAPLVSACLIVKDEEATLPTCLASLEGVCDEVVVLDTGSSDDTVALAERLGARVFRSTWYDDFARSRNEALTHCRGEWVLWIDADEQLVTSDAAALRGFLAASEDVEGFSVTIENLRGTETARTDTHPAIRLFRRACGHWVGAIHELVLARAGERDLHLVPTDDPRLLHRGYLAATVADRDKGKRNLKVAFAGLASGEPSDLGTRLVNLGRSYALACYAEPAAELCRRGADIGSPIDKRSGYWAAGEVALLAGRYEEAITDAARLRGAGVGRRLASLIEGRALLGLERSDEALTAFARLRTEAEDPGFEADPHESAASEARALANLERHGEAADRLLEALMASGGLDDHLGFLFECLEKSGRSPSEIADALPSERVAVFAPQLLQMEPADADRLLEALLARHGDSLPLLATGAEVARHLPVERMIEWSARLRSAGLASACPLALAAADWRRTDEDRCVAAAVAYALFGEERARRAFVVAALKLTPALRVALRSALPALCPALLPLFDSLPAAASASGTTTSGPPDGPSVVLLTRRAADPLVAARARQVAEAGNRVCVLEPGDAVVTAAALSGTGADAFAYSEDDPICSLARVAAENEVDAVILDASTSALDDEIRHLLPDVLIAIETGPDASQAAAGDVRLGHPVPLAAVPLPAALRHGTVILLAAAPPPALQEKIVAAIAGTACVLLGEPCATEDLRFALPQADLVAPGATPEVPLWIASARAVICDASSLASCAPLAHASGVAVIDVASPDLARDVAHARPVEAMPSVCADLLPSLLAPRIRPRVAVTGRRAGDDLCDNWLPAALFAASTGTVLAGPGDLAAQLCSGDRVSAAVAFADGWLPAEWVGQLRCCERILVPSEFARQRAIESGLSSEAIRVIRPELDADFTPLVRTPTTSGTRFLFIGGTGARDGLDALLEAWISWRDDFADARLRVCLSPGDDVRPPGEDPFVTTLLETCVATSGLGVEIVDGGTGASGRSQLYASADVLVHPRRADALGVVPREARTCGLPVVYVAETGLEEVVGTEETVVASTLVPAPSVHVAGPRGFAWADPSRADLARVLARLSRPHRRATNGVLDR